MQREREVTNYYWTLSVRMGCYYRRGGEPLTCLCPGAPYLISPFMPLTDLIRSTTQCQCFIFDCLFILLMFTAVINMTLKLKKNIFF